MNEPKLPPHDTDAEEAVIGSLLIDGAAIYSIADFLQVADFYYEQNQTLYEACLALYQRDEAINQVWCLLKQSQKRAGDTVPQAARVLPGDRTLGISGLDVTGEQAQDLAEG